jgi:hypothetical protein
MIRAGLAAVLVVAFAVSARGDQASRVIELEYSLSGLNFTMPALVLPTSELSFTVIGMAIGGPVATAEPAPKAVAKPVPKAKPRSPQ